MVKPKKAAAKLTIEDFKKENTKLKRVLTLTADKLHEALNAMQPLVADSKDENFIRVYERGRDHIRRNFNLGTELKKKSKKGKKLNDEEMFFESLPCTDKGQKLFQMMRETYTRWHIGVMAKDMQIDLANIKDVPPELKPLWEGRQFGDLKKLENYFLKISVYRAKKHQEETGEVITQEMIKDAANTAWGNLLNGLLSDKVDPFIKKQKKISQILYNLTNIIDQLKNGTGKKASAKDERRKQLEEDQRNIAMATGVEQPHD